MSGERTNTCTPKRTPSTHTRTHTHTRKASASFACLLNKRKKTEGALHKMKEPDYNGYLKIFSAPFFGGFGDSARYLRSGLEANKEEERKKESNNSTAAKRQTSTSSSSSSSPCLPVCEHSARSRTRTLARTNIAYTHTCARTSKHAHLHSYTY